MYVPGQPVVPSPQVMAEKFGSSSVQSYSIQWSPPNEPRGSSSFVMS